MPFDLAVQDDTTRGERSGDGRCQMSGQSSMSAFSPPVVKEGTGC